MPVGGASHRDPSREDDTGLKLDAYKTIPSLREYIIVSHRERRITVHRRNEAGTWTLRVGIAAGRVTVETLGAELAVDAIHRNSSLA